MVALLVASMAALSVVSLVVWWGYETVGLTVDLKVVLRAELMVAMSVACLADMWDGLLVEMSVAGLVDLMVGNLVGLSVGRRAELWVDAWVALTE